MLLPLSAVRSVHVTCFTLLQALWRSSREWFYLLWMSTLLAKDIAEDFFADIWTNKVDIVSLPGEVVIVTGGARGIGVNIVKKLLEGNMFVIVGCRRVEEGVKMFENMRKSGLTSGSLKCYQLDLASRSSIEDFADTVLENHPLIHVLINNAGITNQSRTLTEDGVESTFCINYLGHFYLSHLLLARLADSARTRDRNARIVNVSSCVHRYPLIGAIHLDDLTLKNNYQEYIAYGQSKLAQMMFTKTLDAKMRELDLPVQVHAVHPGVVHTYMMSNNVVHVIFPWLLPIVLRTSEEGSRSVFYACVSPDLESKGGTYISSCSVIPPGRVTNSELMRNHLWRVSKELLQVKAFGGKLL